MTTLECDNHRRMKSAPTGKHCCNQEQAWILVELTARLAGHWDQKPDGDPGELDGRELIDYDEAYADWLYDLEEVIAQRFELPL